MSEGGALAIDRNMMRSERELREMLADLRREYQARAEPIIKALCHFEALRPAPRMVIPLLPDDHPMVVRIREQADRVFMK